MNILVNKKYILNHKIGNGSFGIIMSGYHIITKNKIAIKIEEKRKNSLLKHETKMYNYLRGLKGIPNIRQFGIEGKFNYMVIDVLGESIDTFNVDLHSLKIIGIELIDIIKNIHSKGIIHRDIKPENILEYKNKIYFIDFGLSVPYMIKNIHIQNSKNNKIIGTLNFCSKYIHEGDKPSRRDDIYSILYTLIYLYQGLPWINENNIEMVLSMKREFSYGIFYKLYQYVDSLLFTDTPNYLYIQKLIKHL